MDEWSGLGHAINIANFGNKLRVDLVLLGLLDSSNPRIELPTLNKIQQML